MYFGFLTGIGFNMGLPYGYGNFGLDCYYPMYNPFAFSQYTPNWYTLNNQYNNSWNQYLPNFDFNSLTSRMDLPYTSGYTPTYSLSFSSPYTSFPSFDSYMSMTIPASFSASTMLKNENTNQTKSPETSQKTENKVEQKTEQCTPNPFEGYNEEAGKKLASIALKNTDKFHNQCSAHVNSDIAEANLGNYTELDANQMFEQMRSNPKFREISASVNTDSLLAGTVLIYDKGVAGYGDWGHIEIALGDGRAASDGITKKIKPNPSALFIPIST